MTPSPTHPVDGYAALTPEQVLQALEAAGFRPDGRLLQLNSYENRVYQAFVDDGSAVIAKFYRPGRWSAAQILEEHAFAAELAAAELPVVAALPLADGGTLGHHEADGASYRFSVSPRRAGRAPNLDDPEALRWLGRLLARLHAVGAQRPFAHRRRLDIETFGHRARQLLLAGGFVPPSQLSAWSDASERALRQVQACWDAAGDVTQLRLHGDCHPGNVLWREDSGPHFVDLDDACTGPAVQDLWMLLPGDAKHSGGSIEHLLDGYTQFRDFDRRELRLVEALRTLRMLHHSAWLAERWHDPTFPINFPWFGSEAYWGQQTLQLREQVEAMEEQQQAGAGFS